MILEIKVSQELHSESRVGDPVITDKGVRVACSDGWIDLKKIRLGRKTIVLENLKKAFQAFFECIDMKIDIQGTNDEKRV